MFHTSDLADLIEQAMESDDEIDKTYLLQAIIADLRAGSARIPGAKNVQNLIDNPVS